jgi:hypothetical protein
MLNANFGKAMTQRSILILSDIKRIAARNDIPYQSLIKMLLADKVNEIMSGKNQLIKKL